MTDRQAADKAGARPREDPRPVAPPHSGFDPDWRERIRIAKQAGEQARKARGDKPVTFDTRRLPI